MSSLRKLIEGAVNLIKEDTNRPYSERQNLSITDIKKMIYSFYDDGYDPNSKYLLSFIDFENVPGLYEECEDAANEYGPFVMYIDGKPYITGYGPCEDSFVRDYFLKVKPDKKYNDLIRHSKLISLSVVSKCFDMIDEGHSFEEIVHSIVGKKPLNTNPE